MKSLYTNWIRKKSDKTIPIPEILYFKYSDASGRYYSPQEGYEIYDMYGKPFSLKYGAIVINPLYIDDENAIITHEWRHHMQTWNGVEFDMSPIHYFSKLHYNDALRKYFTESSTELDAVRFQYKHSTIHELWEEVLYDLVYMLKPRPVITYGK